MLNTKLPKELVNNIFDFTGLKEELKKHFSKNVLPQVCLNAIHFSIRYEQKNFYKQLSDIQFHLSPYKQHNAIMVSKGNCHIMTINIVVDPQMSKHISRFLFWDDFSWESIDEVMQFIVRHFVWNMPIPGLTWMDDILLDSML